MAIDFLTRVESSAGGGDVGVYADTDYASLSAAVADIGATPGTLRISTALFLNGATVTVPATLTLEFVGAGTLEITTAQVVTIASDRSNWPVRQIFAGAGTVAFSTGGHVQGIWFPGVDASVKCQAADGALGTNKGTIFWEKDDNWSTSFILNNDHTLRLGRCQLALNIAPPVFPIRMKSRTSIVGSGMYETVILENPYNAGSNGTAWAPGIYAFTGSVYPFDEPTDDLYIANLQIKGFNTYGDGGTLSAIGLGNGKNATIENIFLNGTHVLGITFGGLNLDGNPVKTRDGGKAIGCVFRNIGAQNLNVVNGRNIIFDGNIFIAPSFALGGGVTFLDLETNTQYDYLENIEVVNNVFDSRDAALSPHGNAIAATNGNGSPHAGNIVFADNTFIGGKVTDSDGSIEAFMSNAIISSNLKDVVIKGNVVRRTGQAAFTLHGDRYLVDGNILEGVGGGGSPAMFLELADSRISNNLCLSRVNSVINDGGASDVILESSSVLTGTCDTSGTAVTRVGGGVFPVYPSMQGQTITINGVPYTVAAWIDLTHLTLTASAGVQSGVTWTVDPAGLFDRNTYDGNESDYTAWTGVNATNPVVLTGPNSRVISHYDRTVKKSFLGTHSPTSSGLPLGEAALPWAGVFDGFDLTEKAAPATPASGLIRAYLDEADGKFKYKTSVGTIFPIGEATIQGRSTWSGLELITPANLVGCTESAGIVTSTVGGWGNSGFSSAESIVGDGFIEWKVNIVSDVMIGLSTSDPDQHYTSIQYAFFQNTSGDLQIYESGSSPSAHGAWDANTILRIERVGTTLNYYKDGAQVRQVTGITSAPLVVDAAFNVNGAQASPITLGNLPDDGQVLTYDAASGLWVAEDPSGGGGGAPTASTYITQTPDGSLSAEQALSSLATGLVKNTTGTGVLSIAGAGDLPSGIDAAKLSGGSVSNTEFDYLDGVTSAIQTQINALGGTAAQGARVYHNATQAIASSTDTALAFNQETFDNDVIHDTSTNNSRLICKTAGMYFILGCVVWAPSSTGLRLLRIRLNGSPVLRAAYLFNLPAANNKDQEISTLYPLAVNDYVELVAYHDAGSSLDILSNGDTDPVFSMIRMTA